MEEWCDRFAIRYQAAHSLKGLLGTASGGPSEISATGTRTRVARVRAEYPNQLDYSGSGGHALSDDTTRNSRALIFLLPSPPLFSCSFCFAFSLNSSVLCFLLASFDICQIWIYRILWGIVELEMVCIASIAQW